METRKVTIINSKTQSQKIIQDSKATTLGELKQEMRERGIDYTGMTFFEGHMRAELKDDAATLPTNIPYKGQVVNDLIFMLTAPEKKVKSGAMSRAEAYAGIKDRGLQQACVNKFGRNFTLCSTANLIALIEESSKAKAAPAKVEDGKASSVKAPASSGCNCAKALAILTETLYVNDIIDEEASDTVKAALNECTDSNPEKMSKEEIDEMFGFIER